MNNFLVSGWQDWKPTPTTARMNKPEQRDLRARLNMVALRVLVRVLSAFELPMWEWFLVSELAKGSNVVPFWAVYCNP